jgi:hypothetical protein
MRLGEAEWDDPGSPRCKGDHGKVSRLGECHTVSTARGGCRTPALHSVYMYIYPFCPSHSIIGVLRDAQHCMMTDAIPAPRRHGERLAPSLPSAPMVLPPLSNQSIPCMPLIPKPLSPSDPSSPNWRFDLNFPNDMVRNPFDRSGTPRSTGATAFDH